MPRHREIWSKDIPVDGISQNALCLIQNAIKNHIKYFIIVINVYKFFYCNFI